MSQKRTRSIKLHFEFEIDEDTRDLLDDLLTKYPTPEIIVARAIEALHEHHFGSLSKKKGPLPTIQTIPYPLSDSSSKKIDELLQYIKEIREQQRQTLVEPTKNNTSPVQAQLSPEESAKILAKIDELGVKFTKIIPREEQKKGKRITAEMSQEEILQVIKRIDKLESKLTRVISQSRISSDSGIIRSGREMGPAPKVGRIDGAPPPEDLERPLLEDVLDTVIVSVEDDED